jgi:hypothetical protein
MLSSVNVWITKAQDIEKFQLKKKSKSILQGQDVLQNIQSRCTKF